MPPYPKPTFGQWTVDAVRKAAVARVITDTFLDDLYTRYQETYCSPYKAPPSDNSVGGVPTAKAERLEALRLRICALKTFNRRASTLWTEREMKGLRRILDTPEKDVQVIEWYYGRDIPEATDWRRRDILTLLNNWPGEVDRAKKAWDTFHRTSSNDFRL